MEQLVHIQAKLKAPKNQVNNFGKYKYRSCEDILEGVKPLLTEYGCIINISDEVKLIGDRYYVESTATIINDKGESISTKASAREPENKKGMDESQITGTASSYARKYALNGLLAIDDTKDADTMDNSQKAQKPVDRVVTKEELDVLIALGKQCGAVETKVCKAFGVESYKTLTKKTYDQIINGMNAKIAELAKGAK